MGLSLPLDYVGTPRRQIDGFVSQNRIVALMLRISGLGVALGVLMTLGPVGVAGDGIQSVLFGVSAHNRLI